MIIGVNAVALLFRNFHLARRRERRYICGMYAAYHIQVDELNDKVVQTLKNIYRQGEIVILPKDGGAECQAPALTCGATRDNATVTGTAHPAPDTSFWLENRFLQRHFLQKIFWYYSRNWRG